ncbi:MAG: protein kinase, partial [Acidobacteria bacterium]|nr:protein kinase [Acidobacteriota bacterium]
MLGKTIGHYKVLEKIGQGGMGTVYRAQDTTLDREVAIKVLPEQFTQDPQRLARFEREAKLLASLNHPNIAAIHSFEHADDIHFLVLELVPGETLQERVARGPLPVEEALEVCRQIAEGVEAAHEKGVIHRDLKPANVKVTPEGKVKILDFGLAKAFEAEPPVTDISQSPTLTEEMTRAGVILGTAAYMSPEQAKGEAVDKRADIFAFGCVLYELLTGKRTFDGKTITETLGAIIHKEPDWEALPAITPWRIRDLLGRCLTKDAHDRLHDIANLRIEIKLALEEPTTVSPIGVVSTVQPPLWRRALPWTATLLMGVIAISIAFWSSSSPTLPSLRKLVINPSPTAPLGNSRFRDLAISPDASHVVYFAGAGTSGQLFVRAMDDLTAAPLSGTEGVVREFFFSPDGEWVAFVAGGKLKKVSLVGGAPITLCDVGGFEGGSWGSEGTIVFAGNLGSGTGLSRVSANGGQPEILALPDLDKGEIDYQQPEILPGGKAVLFAVYQAGGTYQIAVLSFDTGEQKTLLQNGRQPHYLPTGHLVYELTATGTLMAVPFDVERLELSGDPIPVFEGVRSVSGQGTADYSISDDGTLIYVPSTGGLDGTLVWVDRQGLATPLIEDRQAYRRPRLSPDGQRVAVWVQSDLNQDIWIYDIGRGTRMRLTVEG